MKICIIIVIFSVTFFESIALNVDQLIVTNKDLVKLSGKCTSCKHFHRPIEYFKKEANKGNDYAQYNMGVIFENGIGVPINRKKAGPKNHWEISNYGRVRKNGEIVELKAPINGYYVVTHNLVHRLVVEYFIGDYLSAFCICQQEAENGNYISQICIEQMYESQQSTSSGSSEDDK